MRQAYQFGLARLNRDTAMMCRAAADCLRDATQALFSADLALAEHVVFSHVQLARVRSSAEAEALELLTLQAPVASDLRTVVAALWNVADLSRMGTMAAHVAESTSRRYPKAVVPQTVRPIVECMSRLALQVADQTGVVLRDRDITLARRVEAEDVLMDGQQRAMFAAVLGPSWSHGVQAAVDVSLLGRCYERFADHSVAVARRVSFMVNGVHPPAFPVATGTGTRPIRLR